MERLQDERIIDFGFEQLWEITRERFGEDDRWKDPAHCVIPLGKALDARGLVRDGERTNGAARRLPASLYPKSELPPRPTAAETCRAIRNANGVVILAHPGSGSKSPSDDERARLRHWLADHVDGIELYHPKNDPDHRETMASIVDATDCPYTGGIDRHSYGSNRPVSETPEACIDQLMRIRRRYS